jgi:hypothetical protein
MPETIAMPEMIAEPFPASILALQMLEVPEMETDFCISNQSSCQSFISNCC